MIRSDEIIVDNFAGGGGASTGMELGLKRKVDIAINHDPEAIAMHKVNHPETKHYCESVWDVDPVEACEGRPVGLAWFSPDCKHFSKAKGGTPVNRNIRGLAWVAVRWALLVPVRIFMLENVEEFKTWGPVIETKTRGAQPCPERKGEIFEGFIKVLTTGLDKNSPVWRDIYQSLFQFNYDIKSKLVMYKKMKKGLGYNLGHKTLHACDYGTPTTRKRFFMVARNDGEQITWPKKTHGKGKVLIPFKTAADIIDWDLPIKSIFGRKKPLVEKTMNRIAKGLKKFIFDSDSPFIVPMGHSVLPFITEHANGSVDRNMPADEPLRTICASVKGGHFALVSPIIDRQFGKSSCNKVDEPLGTITSGGMGKSALVSAHIAKHYTGVVGSCIKGPLHTVTSVDHNALVTSHMIKFRGDNLGHPTDEPVHTISAGGLHIGEVRAFLLKYYGTNVGHGINEPIHTITSKHRFGLVTVHGEAYEIIDIGMRMLQPHELFAAQGFPEDYIIDHNIDGKKITKVSQVARCGNAVCPPVVQALVECNFQPRRQLDAA